MLVGTENPSLLLINIFTERKLFIFNNLFPITQTLLPPYFLGFLLGVRKGPHARLLSH